MKLPAAIALVSVVPFSWTLADDAEVPTGEELKFFESKIRPVLADYCYKCHSADEKVKGGFTVDTRDGVRHGGDSGPAVVPGDLEKSLLWSAVNWQDDLEMPPKQKLPTSAIADLKKWIEMGAPDPRVAERTVVKTEIDIEEGKKFWSFQKPEKKSVPPVKDANWAKSDIDRFVQAEREKHGLKPASDAKPEDLLRRLHFDLTGLPPTISEIETFAKEWRMDSARAYGKKVDDLLAGKHFGERWGRHWLDVARYAESTGKDVNMTFPYAWRYRDYVIDSFNEDKPYDRFLKEQIAGDLLKIKSDEDWRENLIATGFLAIGPKGLNEMNPRQFALDLADEQIDATTQAILGLTVSCARCHDHKSDPIPTTDYYALSGIFQSTKTYFGTVNLVINRRATKLLELPVPDETPMTTISQSEIEALRARLRESEKQFAELRNGRRDPNNQQQIIRLRRNISQARARINAFDHNGDAKSFAMGVQDYEEPTEPRVYVRGELDKPGQDIPRGFLQVLDHAGTPKTLPKNASGRLELAEWLTSKENPLTARVMVNRIWSHLFGNGIVTSQNNFGATGQTPTHPELLDHLAVKFMDGEWSVKSLIRELVHTRTYRMGSDFDSQAYEEDPENKFHWRSAPRQLDAESLRDAMLVASGQLDTQRPIGSIVSEAGDSPARTDLYNRQVSYRSVYLPFVRDALPESLDLFDPADPNIVTGARESTNVPGQALYLMNNPFVIRQADLMAKRLVNEAKTPRERFERAFLLAYGRVATKPEINSAMNFFRSFVPAAERETKDKDRAGFLALSTFCQSLMASAEFRYLN